MEKFITLVTINWPILLEYAGMFIAYFLVFLFRSKVSGTERNLNLAFKEFRTRFTENEAAANEKLEASKARYTAAVNKIEKLEARVEALTDTILILLGDEYLEAENITEKPEVENDIQYEVDDQ